MTGVAAVEGAGPDRVLVLHGWALDSGVWLTTRALTDQARFTYAYVDFPGYGAAASQPPARSMDAMAEYAIAAADSLGWDTFGVLGHSMGGATAITVARLAPARVQAVVALTPVTPAGTPFDDATFTSFVDAWVDPGPVLFSLAPNLSPNQLTRLVERNKATMTQPVWEQYLSNWVQGSADTHLGEVAVPISLVYGEDDSFVTRDYLSETVAALPNASSDGLSGAGHYPMLEQPERSVELWENVFGGPKEAR